MSPPLNQEEAHDKGPFLSIIGESIGDCGTRFVEAVMGVHGDATESLRIWPLNDKTQV